MVDGGRSRFFEPESGSDHPTLDPFEVSHKSMAPPPQPAEQAVSAAVIGVSLACLAAATNAAGLNLQRWATQRNRSRLNVLGVVLSASCGLIDMASFAFAPQSLLAPFGSLTIVINLLLAAPLHGDVISPVDLVSTALVFGGVAT